MPHLAFQSQGSVGVQPNQLVLTMQPNEGVSLSLGAKIPGSRMRIRPVNMEFLYGSAFMSQSPEAYERLIMDAMRGDATLFTRNDEVDAQWSIIDPVLEAWRGDGDRPLPCYEAGTAGPGGGRRADRARARVAEAVSEDVWSERDTTPSAIEAALRGLLGRRYQEDRAFVPARVMNLVVIVERGFRGEVENRLARVGRYHPSRLIVVAVEEGRGTLDAMAAVAAEDAVHKPGHIAVGRERVEIDIGPQHLGSLDSIVDPLLVSDLATMVWAPHGHRAGVDALRRLANIVLIDTQDEPEVGAAFERAADLTGSAYVVDLAWLRSTPWRERVAATFDPPPMRQALGAIDKVDRAPPAGLDGRGPALLRLARVAAGLAPEPAVAPRRPARRPLPRAPRGGRARAAPARDGRARAGRRDDRDGVRRGRLTRPRPRRAARLAPQARRRGAGLDGARRVARRVGHPRRGRASGAAARPDVQARAGSWQDAGRMIDVHVVEDPAAEVADLFLDIACAGGQIALSAALRRGAPTSSPRAAMPIRARRRCGSATSGSSRPTTSAPTWAWCAPR